MPEFDPADPLESVWLTDGAVGYVDQRALPHQLVRRRAERIEDVIEAIRTLAVRGAPAIGVFAAYGLAVTTAGASATAFAEAAARIRAARPTAVNLAWAIDRLLEAGPLRAFDEARTIHEEQISIDRCIGEAAVALFPQHGNVLTHCNTGPLATAGDGTALGTIVAAQRAGKRLHVYVDETRPLLQGARLTMYELQAAHVPATLIVDGAAAATMRQKDVRLVVVGADRIARNGDTANKIGTYGVAVAAAYHGIPFYVAAPRSTFDCTLASGEEIPIEERNPAEVLGFAQTPIAPAASDAFNPAFDVTPAALIAGFITEYGVTRPPYLDSIAWLAAEPPLSLEILRLR